MSDDYLTPGGFSLYPPPTLHARHVLTFPPGVECVGMAVHNGTVIVATTAGIYYLENDQLVPIQLTPAPDATQS